MATRTLGTNGTTTLKAISYANNGAGLLPADIATIAQSIKNDQGNLHATVPGAFARAGLLFIPNRGVLKVLPGDFVGVDASGWPVLISAYALSYGSTSWTHT